MTKLFYFFILSTFTLLGSAFTSEKKLPPGKASLVFPVSGKKSSVKGYWGEYRNGNRRHKGIDIYAKKGTPVVAVSDGIVTEVSNGGKGGRCVWVKSASHSWTAYYAHLDKQKVRTGQYVKKGQVLGTVGNTGNAKYTPSHLHFGIYTKNGAVNPLPYVKNSPKILLASRQPVTKKTSTSSKSKTASKRSVSKPVAKR